MSVASDASECAGVVEHRAVGRCDREFESGESCFGNRCAHAAGHAG
jgi:hypothetical protein